jgi:hypothetical protein
VRSPHKMTFILTRAEIVRLREEIGNLPKSHAGPKLLELYRRLDDALTPKEDEDGAFQKEEEESR